ncbi:MAG: 16S rRNA (guanine(527)-N(7))-methyltransferase RsmG [Desulfamplus sp.]|nr:16S rRNA (guanine(527)-N(7))-methyltransferase RsmG [Desulfamplus sp.]
MKKKIDKQPEESVLLRKKSRKKNVQFKKTSRLRNFVQPRKESLVLNKDSLTLSVLHSPKNDNTASLFGDDWQQTVARGVLTFGIELSSKQLDLLTFHAGELIKWNSRFNITAIVEPFEMALKHFIDSIAIAPFIPYGSRVIDLGTGGGFPGMPLKVINPTLEVVMADSSRKKVSFLNNLIMQSNLLVQSNLSQSTISCQNDLNGITAIHCRAEELGKDPEYAHQFDFVISRAFTALDRFTDMALPFLKSSGAILAMKGDLSPDELSPVVIREDITAEISEYVLPFEQHKRCIVKIRLSEFYQDHIV